MKKLICLFVCAVTLFTLASCSKNFSPEGIKKRGELVVATNAEFPPFEYFGENNDIVGFDMDLAREIAKELGVTIKINHMDFDAVLAAVSSGKADIAMAGLTVSEQRLKSVSFSDGYFTASQVVLVKSDVDLQALTKDALDHALIGLKIGVQRGTVGGIYVQGDDDWGYPGIQNAVLSEYDNGYLAVQDLINGRLNAVVIDEAPARIFVADYSGIKIIESNGTLVKLTDEEYAIATKRGNTALVDFLNTTLDKLKTNPETGSSVYGQLIEKYFGY
jgi:polar amino acid transport system substrate-binding protein